MKIVRRGLFLIAILLLVAACAGTPQETDGKAGGFVISNVLLNNTGPGNYEVMYDATWEGDLPVHESPCDVYLMGSDGVLLGEGKVRIESTAAGLTTTIEEVKGTPERAEVLCPTVSVIP